MSAAPKLSQNLPDPSQEGTGTYTIGKLHIEYEYFPEEPESRQESGYSLGYPGAPARVEITDVTAGHSPFGDISIMASLDELCFDFEETKSRILESILGQ